MESTLRQALKSRKVRDVKGYYSYQLLLDTVREIYRSANALDLSLSEVQAFEKIICSNPKSFNESNSYEMLDFLLLSAICYPSLHPVFVVKQELCESLYQTSCAKKGLVVSHPFIDSGIILMPRFINGQKTNASIYVFGRKKDTIIVCSLDAQIGYRGASCFSLNRPNGGVESFNPVKKVDFLFNLFLYKESVENTATETELVIPQSRGFGTAKNTNQKQIIIPRMIGADYKPKTIRQESTGTHASPTTHWRSGHWRQQLIGKKENPDHKTIWIEPVLVNG
jgi:hypothetical protein